MLLPRHSTHRLCIGSDVNKGIIEIKPTDNPPKQNSGTKHSQRFEFDYSRRFQDVPLALIDSLIKSKMTSNWKIHMTSKETTTSLSDCQKSLETTLKQMRQQHNSIVRDAGLNLAGGAQKLSGPH